MSEDTIVTDIAVETPEADEATTQDTVVDDAAESFTSEAIPSRFSAIEPAAATGRRKEAVARVRIVPGTGKWLINGRELDAYFPNKVHQQLVNEPFTVLELVGKYDVIARLHGGGVSGQAGALRLGVARCAQRGRPRQQPSGAQEGRLPDPRRAGDRAQEGRSQEGPEGAAVLQAVDAVRGPRVRQPHSAGAALGVSSPRAASVFARSRREGLQARGSTVRH